MPRPCALENFAQVLLRIVPEVTQVLKFSDLRGWSVTAQVYKIPENSDMRFRISAPLGA